MKTCKRCATRKPVSEFSTHAGSRDGLQAYCKSCAMEIRRAWTAANPDKNRARAAKWRAANRDKAVSSGAKCRAANPGYAKRYYDANPAKFSMYKANRRARKKNATPTWFSELDAFAIEEAYALAEKRAVVIGGEWQVDHIVPLAGKLACGLHVGRNLQVITAEANKQKRHKFDPLSHSEARDSVFVGVCL